MPGPAKLNTICIQRSRDKAVLMFPVGWGNRDPDPHQKGASGWA